jgi:hypothetical protein
MDPYEDIKYWLEVIDYYSSLGFSVVKDDQLTEEQAWADSTRWNFEFFAPDTNPLSPDIKVERSVHVSDATGADILRHVYCLEDLDIEVLESAAFSVVRFESQETQLLSLPVDERKVTFTSRVAKLLSETAQIQPDSFVIPEGTQLVDGCLISTNEKEDPNVMSYWPSRIDGGIRAAKPFVLLYKKSVGRIGYPPLMDWFSKQL